MTATDDLRRYLEKTHAFKAEHCGVDRTPEGDVLAHGEWFTWSPLPDDLEYGPLKECYGNSTHVVTGQRWYDGPERYAYYEGYGYTTGLIVTEHAWVVDTETGKAYDPTWRDGGNECGFCLANGTITEEVTDEDGEWDGEEERECGWCDGTGVADIPHPVRNGTTAYVGMRIPTDLLIERLHETGVYGFFSDGFMRDPATYDRAIEAQKATA